MSLHALTWRLRVRTPKDDGDLFVVTSLRLNDDPGRIYNYLRDPPKHDGLQIDPLTGQVTVGACTVTIIDQCATIIMSSDGTAVPAPPPAPGNLIVGDMLLSGAWALVRDAAQTSLSGTYPPVSPDSYAAWPGASGQWEVWAAFHGSIGGGGAFLYEQATFGPADGLVATTNYVLRALGQITNAGTPPILGIDVGGGFALPALPAFAEFPATHLDWRDYAVLTDGAGNFTIKIGALDLEVGNAAILFAPALMLFDATGTPADGGSPAGDGGAFGSGRGRLVTSYLADLAARWRLLGLKAYLEESTDGGSSWTTVFASYVGHARHVT